MRAFQEQSGKDRKKLVITAVQGELPKTDDSPKYDGLIRPRQGRRLGQGQRRR